MLHFILASGIGDILFLFSDIFTVSEREGVSQYSFLKHQQIMDIMSIMRNFFSSPTRMSSVVPTILAIILYATSPPDDSWFVVGVIAVHVVPVILVIMIYEICSIHQARNRARSASVNHLIDCDAPQHYVPSSEAFPTRRRLQDLRLQIALVNREIDEFEHLTYSSANIFGIPSMTDEEINALPVHHCKCTGLESENAPAKQVSSASTSASASASASAKELLCNICLEPIMEGDLVFCFPSCIHKFHAACLDKWLVLSASCPVCDLC